jgi:hypothetical protein
MVSHLSAQRFLDALFANDGHGPSGVNHGFYLSICAANSILEID